MTKWCTFLPVRKQAVELSCTKKFVLVLCILVQLSSRWYLCTLESLYALRPVFQKFPQHCLWNSSRVPRPFKEDRWACFFWRLFPPGEWSCDVFGFVIGGSVSSCVLHQEVVFTGQLFFYLLYLKGMQNGTFVQLLHMWFSLVCFRKHRRLITAVAIIIVMWCVSAAESSSDSCVLRAAVLCTYMVLPVLHSICTVRTWVVLW